MSIGWSFFIIWIASIFLRVICLQMTTATNPQFAAYLSRAALTMNSNFLIYGLVFVLCATGKNNNVLPFVCSAVMIIIAISYIISSISITVSHISLMNQNKKTHNTFKNTPRDFSIYNLSVRGELFTFRIDGTGENSMFYLPITVLTLIQLMYGFAFSFYTYTIFF